jgi:hypothetical protein
MPSPTQPVTASVLAFITNRISALHFRVFIGVDGGEMCNVGGMEEQACVFNTPTTRVHSFPDPICILL